MSLGSINSSHSSWGTPPSSSASTFGVKDASAEFRDTLKSSMSFGSKNESGELINSVSSTNNTLDNLVSQLQYSLLKNYDGSGGKSGLMNNALM